MYAQLVQGGAAPENRQRMDAVVHDQLLPALAEEPGYAGAFNLVDRETGNALMLMLWETREHAELPIAERGTAFLRALASVTEISSGQRAPISIWEVNAANVNGGR